MSEWPRALTIMPTVVTALDDEVRADQTYFLSWDGQDVYLAGDIARHAGRSASGAGVGVGARLSRSNSALCSPEI